MPEIPIQPWTLAAAMYPVIQSIALARLAGTLRALSLILTVVMVAVCALAGAAFYLEPSNLWEMILMLAMPPAVVLSLGLLLLGLVVRPPARA